MLATIWKSPLSISLTSYGIILMIIFNHSSKKSWIECILSCLSTEGPYVKPNARRNKEMLLIDDLTTLPSLTDVSLIFFWYICYLWYFEVLQMKFLLICWFLLSEIFFKQWGSARAPNKHILKRNVLFNNKKNKILSSAPNPNTYFLTKILKIPTKSLKTLKNFKLGT